MDHGIGLTISEDTFWKKWKNAIEGKFRWRIFDILEYDVWKFWNHELL